MAYDRFDSRRGRDDGSRWQRGREDERGSAGGRAERSMGGESGRHNEGGFFERAGEQISSWFGDGEDDRDHRSERGDWRERQGGERQPGQNRGTFAHGGSGAADYNPRWRELSGSGERERFDRDRDSGEGYRGYRPITGDYGRSHHKSEQFFASSGAGRGERGSGDQGRGEFERSQTQWGRDDYRRTSGAGTSQRGHDFDPQYHSWRERQMSDLDRDYDEYRRENQSRFEREFSTWREQRQQKRTLLRQIREQMMVQSMDGEPVGTVERVAGDRIILTKSDPESGGAQHSISCADIDRIDGDAVVLGCTSEQAKQRWRDESRGRALFEPEDQGQVGAHVLDQSFGGTYR